LKFNYEPAIYSFKQGIISLYGNKMKSINLLAENGNCYFYTIGYFKYQMV